MDAQPPIRIQIEEADGEQPFEELGGLALPAHDISEDVTVHIEEHPTDRAVKTPRPQRHQPPDDRVAALTQQTGEAQRFAMRDRPLVHLDVTHTPTLLTPKLTPIAVARQCFAVRSAWGLDAVAFGVSGKGWGWEHMLDEGQGIIREDSLAVQRVSPS